MREKSGNKKWDIRINNMHITILLLVVLFIAGQIILSGFASLNNIANIAGFACVIALVAVSQLFVMVVGNDGIDLSVGAIMSMSALLFADICRNQASRIPFSLLCVLCAGLIVEAINFAGITLLKISPMIMTMIMGTVVNGFNYFYTRGIVSGSIPEQIMMIGRQAAGPFKTIVFIVILLLLLTGLGLRHLKLGKKMFLVGSNDNAAGLCGIRTERVRFAAYLFSGTFAVIAGIMLLGLSGAAILKMGESYVMMSIAAAVIGGVQSGEGKVAGCFLGAAIIQTLTNLLIAANLPDSLQILFNGIVLMLILSSFARKPRLQD